MVIQSKPTLHDSPSAARFIGIKPNTLAIWRCTKRYNLAYLKIGRKVFYDERDLVNFLESRRIQPTEVMARDEVSHAG
jgi:hypothetical protein